MTIPSSPQTLANAIRFLSVDAIVRAGEGHQGVPLGMAEIATALYLNHLKHDPECPTWWDRDRVVLSNGHGSMLLYSLLYLTGYKKITLEQIKSFRELGSHCAGHPELDPDAGIEVTTGQLGQGIANAMGMAVCEAFLRARFGSELVNHYTYAFVGDGCLQEGVGQEMISLAGHLGLGRLILLMDDNAITDDGSTELSISEDVAKRFEVAQWHVQRVDGHDCAAISTCLSAAREDARPSIILARTTIAKGLARLQGQRGGHSAKLFEADSAQMRNDLNWPHPAFEIPASILEVWRASPILGQSSRAQWLARVAVLSAEKRAEFERIMRGDLPHTLEAALLLLKEKLLSEPPRGGINLSAAINDCLTDHLPERIVACADLEAPTDHKKRLDAFSVSKQGGAYIHCGVREHLMGSMCNGIAAHGGAIPVSVTYLAFSDYMRPALRNAALMKLPVKFVFSHDSIGIGKNGPTHQPVEILASLRAMPHMLVMRPADAVEAVECWDTALNHKQGPVSLIFSRQALPHVRMSSGHDNLSARGAYVLVEGNTMPRQITLLATGSEVAIALKAREQLEALGLSTAVISMPCWELFDRQQASYRAEVLCPGTTTVAIEAAVKLGWERYLGHNGGFVGMNDYGLSGPADALYEHFGINAEKVTEAALAIRAIAT
jgi:transketolase